MLIKKRGLFLVVLFLFLLAPLSLTSFAQSAGCYFYPEAEDYYCASIASDIAAEDCGVYDDCNLDDFFKRNSDCNDVPQCKLVTCNVNCQDAYLGKCELQGGKSVESEGYDYWCAPGCCIIDIPGGANSCSFPVMRYACADGAVKKGFDYVLNTAAGMSLSKCLAECDLELKKATLQIIVVDENNEITEADVNVIQADVAPSFEEGKYVFSLNPGTYVVEVTKPGFLPLTLTVTLSSEELVEKEAFLQKTEALANVKVIVSSMEGLMEGATINWEGPSRGSGKTNGQGEILVEGLFLGTYKITAGKVGFQALEKTLFLKEGENELEFLLEPETKEKIFGITFVDFDNDGEGKAVNGVRIFLDGVIVGSSKWPKGNYEIPIEASEEEHSLFAVYQDYQSEIFTFTLSPGETVQRNLLLTTFKGECSKDGENPNKNMENFVAQHVLGEKKVRLQWKKPCPEVVGYKIFKFQGTEEVDTLDASLAQNFIIDEDVEWDQTYSYEIIAVYESGLESEAAAKTSITLGEEYCEGRFDSERGIWDRFCSNGKRDAIYSCTNENRLDLRRDCSSLGLSYYCASTGSGNADCKDAGMCSFGAAPFGLYSSKNQCYGTSNLEEIGAVQNFCYYDYTVSIVDSCQSCAEINNCYDYKGEEACKINACLTDSCKWIRGAENSELVDYSNILPFYSEDSLLITPETGAGYCVEEDYQKDDTCSLCGPKGDIFENYYCTAEVCSNLGRCFSSPSFLAPALSACLSCGENPGKDANCYTYITEKECVGEKGITKNEFGLISLGEDSCGWGRCTWTGVNCIKDGNVDQVSDCDGLSGSDYLFCQSDNTPPRTFIPAKESLVSLADPNITFFGSDAYHQRSFQESRMGLLKYCLTPLGASESDSCAIDNFIAVPYQQDNSEESLKVNVLNFPLKEEVNGKSYRLKYFSEDIYHNQENVKETFVFIDNIAPKFVISDFSDIQGEEIDLTIFLEEDSEPMSCIFNLAPINPLGANLTRTVGRDVYNKEVSFNGLKGVRFDLAVTCKDDYGNEHTETRSLVFDLEPSIDLIYPPLHGYAAKTAIAFEITTEIGAICSLYNSFTNEKIATFITDMEGKKHKTNTIPNFVEGDYAAVHKIICEEILTGEIYEDYFDFSVDFTPPATIIILKEGERLEFPLKYGWEQFFLESVEVSFDCVEEGISCDKTFYCLGDECPFLVSPDYKEFEEPFILEDTTQICYFSTDVADNSLFQVTCGTILVEGHGLVLENPRGYYYNEELWGITNKATFDWQFYTRIPTVECRFDAVSGFDYDDIPDFRVLTQNSEERYRVEGFPESMGVSSFDEGDIKVVYVQCLDALGEIGPDQKVNLEYDPSAPQIKDAFTEPKVLIEGKTVKLKVETDDKTFCKYSDSGHTNFDLMPYSFPSGGNVYKILRRQHQDIFQVTPFTGLIRKFSLNTICSNGAGDRSGLKVIDFTVDYTQKGGIYSFYPDGNSFSEKAVTLTVETTKNAFCEYKGGNNGTYLIMGGAGGRIHTTTLSNLAEGEYRYPFKCEMGEHKAEGVFTFIIDQTPPKIKEIDDGKFSCGKDKIKIMVYTEKENVTDYEYELYETSSSYSSFFAFTNMTNSGGSLGGKTLLFKDVIDSGSPFYLPLEGLNKTKRYLVKVRAGDAAGNWGEFKESDGFEISNENRTECEDDGEVPLISVITDKTSCNSISVELRCRDDVGCYDLRYGQSAGKEECVTDSYYNGQMVSFSESGFICYNVSDTTNNNGSGIQEIIFTDEDGDKVADHCDLCLDTNPGDVADADGCADGQLKEGEEIDTDSDGLPDSWEKDFDSTACPLSYFSLDSNDDGVIDASEDYDHDGYENYQEYQSGTDPCSTDEPRPSYDEEEPIPFVPSLPEKETDLAAWILLIIGLLLVFGGIGFLVYFYKYSPAARETAMRTRPASAPAVRSEKTERLSVIESWKEKLSALQRERLQKKRFQRRQSVFGRFTTQSKEIPHLGKALQEKKPTLSKLHDLSHKYLQDKDKIKPGLQSHEKSIFNRLENIAQKTKDKKIEEVVSKDEAKNIFSKLRDLSKKRKEK